MLPTGNDRYPARASSTDTSSGSETRVRRTDCRVGPLPVVAWSSSPRSAGSLRPTSASFSSRPTAMIAAVDRLRSASCPVPPMSWPVPPDISHMIQCSIRCNIPAPPSGFLRGAGSSCDSAAPQPRSVTTGDNIAVQESKNR